MELIFHKCAALMRLSGFVLVLIVAGGCAHEQTFNPPTFPPGTDSARDGMPVTRAQVLLIAQAYAAHEWRGTPANVFHGTDAKGIRVDTPDAKWWGRGGWHADDRMNTGIPYCWGGDSTLAEFDAGIAAGVPAGCQFKKMDRKNDPATSELPVGVDCSGLVSRCWRLRVRKSTYDMTDVSDPLPSLDDLRPGDAVNKPHNHIILFIAWTSAKHDKMLVYEGGDAKKSGDPINHSRVHQDVYDRDWLVKHNFVPLRYHNIED